jgi:hypothetical protein
MYRNIRFAFFQPAENDMITLVHFHLHNPIMIGNKKTKDVQFYAEVRKQDGAGWRAALGWVVRLDRPVSAWCWQEAGCHLSWTCGAVVLG